MPGAAGGAAGFSFGGLACPNLGFFALQVATIWGSTCGNGLVAIRRCGVPFTIGRMQSTTRPVPVLQPLVLNPACTHASMIGEHAPPDFLAAGAIGAPADGGTGAADGAAAPGGGCVCASAGPGSEAARKPVASK